MPLAFFTSDLHGRPGRYRALAEAVSAERPAAVFLGGDLLPHGMDRAWDTAAHGKSFVAGYLAPLVARLRDDLPADAPRIFLILGNDDPFGAEEELLAGEREGLWTYLHRRRADWAGRAVYGYNCVPPTPFLLKDWERYDVSRYVEPGGLSPEEGRRGDGLARHEIRWTTIKDELDEMVGDDDLRDAILMAHSPPYGSHLDRAALDGMMVDHAPLDVHVGSIALQRFIAARQPAVTLHGHIHETVRLTGEWRQVFGRTHAFTGVHHGPELPLVRFDPDRPEAATRSLLRVEA